MGQGQVPAEVQTKKLGPTTRHWLVDVMIQAREREETGA